MPSEKARRRAGATGPGGGDNPEEAKVARAPKSAVEREARVRASAVAQAAIFNREYLQFEVEIDDAKLRIAIPAKFTIGDERYRSALDDLDAFGRLLVFETRKLAPDDAPGIIEFFKDPRYNNYVEIAMSLSNVRELMRRVASKVGRRIDEKDELTDERFHPAVFERLSTRDLLFLGHWFVRRWFEVLAQQKNALQTTPVRKQTKKK